MTQRYEQSYKVKRRDNLGDPEFWNVRFQDLDLRLAARELDGARIEGAVEELTAVALQRLDDTFTPVVDEAIERLNSVGALFSSTSDTETIIGPGSKTFLLDVATRTGFVVPEYVGIRPAGLSDRGMIAQATAYDRATGLLDVEVVLFSGAGTYDDWVIRITGAPDVDHATRTDNPHATTAAQVGAYTIAQADTAIGNAVTGAVSAEVTARNGAIAAAITALKGGVSTAYDTLVEIAAKLADDDTVIGTLITGLGNRLRFDAAQALTVVQKKQALSNLGAWEPGDAKLSFRATASPGWFFCNDGSIGDALSGATTRAADDTLDCFVALFDAIPSLVVQDSTGATVGRGIAATHWALHHRLVIPKTMGRAIAIAGTGAGLTARTLGTTAGSETETPTLAKTASHGHRVVTYGLVGNGGDFNQLQAVSAASNGAGLGGTPNPSTENSGGGAALNIVQPEFFINIAIKL